jgi:hypothetical protein
MKQQAEQGGANWGVVLKADAAPHDSLDWKNLNVLIDRCVPAIKEAMRSPEKTKLLINPGRLRATTAESPCRAERRGWRSDGIRGIWALVPESVAND